MAKGAYIGVNNVAKKIKKGYIGDTSGKARKIKKGYIGIGGVARPFISSQIIEYYGEITPLSAKRIDVASTSFLDNTGLRSIALFAGGNADVATQDPGLTTVDAYNYSLVRSTPAVLSFATCSAVGGKAGSGTNMYGLIAGGRATRTGIILSTVNAYSNSLSRSIPTSMSTVRNNGRSGHINNYCVFFGGHGATGAVDAYNASLTRSNPTAMSEGRQICAVERVGNYLLVAGGYGNSTGACVDTVDAYNSSLTKSTAPSLSSTRYQLTCAHTTSYAIFTCGLNGSTYTQDIDVYNGNLTKISGVSTLGAIYSFAYSKAGFSIDQYAFFPCAGTFVSADYARTMHIYDNALTHTMISNVIPHDWTANAEVIGGYALTYANNFSPSVYAWKYTN